MKKAASSFIHKHKRALPENQIKSNPQNTAKAAFCRVFPPLAIAATPKKRTVTAEKIKNTALPFKTKL
jgi:hypothetical protein